MFNLIIYGVISFWKIIFGFLIFTRIFTEKRRDKKWIERLGWGILTILAIDQAWDSCHGFIPWLQIVVCWDIENFLSLHIPGGFALELAL